MTPLKTPRPGPRARARARPLSELLAGTSRLAPPTGAGELRIRGISASSRAVREGSLFVAIRGTRDDGHRYLDEAVQRGAAAVVVEEAPAADPGVPVIRAASGRRALAELAAAWHGRPADRLTLVGITGTVGKTSTLSVLEAVLAAAGRRAATLGSLGLRIDAQEVQETGYTAPDPLLLHQGLARAEEEGCDLVVMEVTSHALAQERVAGLELDLGILTNLIPLEHQDYHGSFAGYLEAKRRFFRHLPPCAPLVYDAANRAARRVVHDYPVEPVGCGTTRAAVARIEPESVSAAGTRMTLNLRRPIPRLAGGEVEPGRIPLEMRLLGRSNLTNAALAATAGLCLGAEPEAVREALARFPPPRRRMEVVHQGHFTVLDDTVGHPDSISALFEAVGTLAPRRVHIAFAVRGQRGARINRQTAQALAIWCSRMRPATLVVTRSAEATDQRNRVDDREHEAFRRPLRERGVAFSERDRLDDAVEEVLERAGEGDLVLLLGAQGMDRGGAVAREWLAARERR